MKSEGREAFSTTTIKDIRLESFWPLLPEGVSSTRRVESLIEASVNFIVGGITARVGSGRAN